MTASGSFHVGARRVGGGAPVLVIAEAGVNHDGSRDKALALVDAAAAAGADAVKFQTFTAESLVAADAPKAEYQKARGAAESQLEMLQRLELSRADHEALIARAKERGVMFLSTPFDVDSARMLIDLGVPALKLGSGELTDTPLLAEVATLGVPLLVSTGMATLVDVERAMTAVAANASVALLHCVSAYPAAADDANLLAMATLRERFHVPVGFSDHTEGTAVSVAAAALGAELIEKHFTLDKSSPGPDHAFSLEPAELAALVRDVRTVERARGTSEKRVVDAERAIARVARKSLVARRALSAGTKLAAVDLRALRPADGLPPYHLDRIVGRTLKHDVAAGARIRDEDLA